MATVKVIQATLDQHTKLELNSNKKRRVAGYARVSTDQDEQFFSFTAQVDYYTNLININPEWELVEIYTDEGIFGTNTKRREGFQRMIKDALDGKIDLILTKSISRFARNTVDSLTTIRKLKEHNVEVYFEKENIYTFDSKGELLITIMSSIAQEESRSTSENVTWGKRKSFADGKVWWSYSQFIGYRKGADGKPEILPEEAELIKNIYNWFLYDGLTQFEIAQRLNDANVPTCTKKGKWETVRITNILKNEKYKGDALLQKTYTESFLTHKLKKNNGEVPQYYVENNHPAIIDKDTWELVQIELERRKSNFSKSGQNLFANLLFCSECGNVFGPQVFHSNEEKYRTIRYVCNGKKEKYNREKLKFKCPAVSVREEYVIEAFLECFKRWFEKKDAILERYEELDKIHNSQSKLDKEIAKLTQEKANLIVAHNEFVNLAKAQAMAPAQYQSTLDKYNNQIEKLNEQISEKNFIKYDEESEWKRYRIAKLFLAKMEEPLKEYDRFIFRFLIDRAEITPERNITFNFVDGSSEIYFCPAKPKYARK